MCIVPECCAKAQRRTRIVAQHVDAEREVGRDASHGVDRARHRRDGLAGDRPAEERHVAEVLDDERVQATVAQAFGVLLGARDHGVQIAAEARSTGQGAEMDDAHELRTGGLEIEGRSEHRPNLTAIAAGVAEAADVRLGT